MMRLPQTQTQGFASKRKSARGSLPSRMLPALLLALLTLLPLTAAAHGVSRSSSAWWASSDGGINVRLSVATRELTRISPDGVPGPLLNAAAIEHFTDTVSVFAGDVACEQSRPVVVHDDQGQVWLDASYKCDGAPLSSLEINFLQSLGGKHLHLARVEMDTSNRFEFMVTSADQRLAIEPATAPRSPYNEGQNFLNYLQVGIAHILQGWDHLAFLLALILAYPSWKTLLFLVTGFTLGHATTICAVVLGNVLTHPPAVESLIALSILLVAGQSMPQKHRGRSDRAIRAAIAIAAIASVYTEGLRTGIAIVSSTLAISCALSLQQRVERGTSASTPAMMLTAGFGFVHGLGFAGVLLEMLGSSPQRDQLVLGLLGFNLGVEAVQVALVLVGAMLVTMLGSFKIKQFALLRPTAIASLAAVASYWLIRRACGI